MGTVLAPLICCLVTLASTTSSALPPRPGVSSETEARAEKWVLDLHEMGIRVEGDSLRVSDDARRVMADSAYRRVVYPETYRWEAVKPLVDAHQLKIAVWHLINLFDADSGTDVRYREGALKTLTALDGPLEMDRVLLGAFYTYGLLDPRVCSWHGGHPEITRPDLVERRLAVVKDLIGRILAYRKLRQQKSDSTHDGIPSGGER